MPAVIVLPAAVLPVYPNVSNSGEVRSDVLSAHKNNSGKYLIFSCSISSFLVYSTTSFVSVSIVLIYVTPVPLYLPSIKRIRRFFERMIAKCWTLFRTADASTFPTSSSSSIYLSQNIVLVVAAIFLTPCRLG